MDIKFQYGHEHGHKKYLSHILFKNNDDDFLNKWT